MSSVRLSDGPSVCPSVTVYQDHTGWKSWKLIARTVSTIHSLFVAQRPSTYSQRNMGKFWRLEVGWERVTCWSTKAAISLKCVKTEEKLLWTAIYELTNALSNRRTAPTPTPYGFPFPNIRLQPQPQTAIAIISGTGKATDCRFGRYIRRVHLNTSP